MYTHHRGSSGLLLDSELVEGLSPEGLPEQYQPVPRGAPEPSEVPGVTRCLTVHYHINQQGEFTYAIPRYDGDNIDETCYWIGSEFSKRIQRQIEAYSEMGICQSPQTRGTSAELLERCSENYTPFFKLKEVPNQVIVDDINRMTYSRTARGETPNSIVLLISREEVDGSHQISKRRWSNPFKVEDKRRIIGSRIHVPLAGMGSQSGTEIETEIQLSRTLQMQGEDGGSEISHNQRRQRGCDLAHEIHKRSEGYTTDVDSIKSISDTLTGKDGLFSDCRVITVDQGSLEFIDWVYTVDGITDIP